MDTQGLFDHQASTQISFTIGTLSFVLSSLQCFNIRQQINDQTLDLIYVSIWMEFVRKCKIYADAPNMCMIIACNAWI